jgi:hypothetical protein
MKLNTDKIKVEIINEIPEIKSIIFDIKHLKKRLKKNRRRLVTFSDFIKGIIMPKNEQIQINSIIKYLKLIGFKNVYDVHKKTNEHREKEQDIEIKEREFIVLIEVKDTKNNNAANKECSQILSYIGRKKTKNKYVKIYGVTILNHNNKESDINKRNKNPFSKTQINDAKINKYGLLNTVDIINSLIEFKKGNLSESEIKDEFKKEGLIISSLINKTRKNNKRIIVKPITL